MIEKEKKRMDWFNLAMQYYISARFSHYAGCTPVFGNLFHHSIEMSLKGYLSYILSEKQLKDKFGHNLAKIWKEFKSQASDSALERFDQTIKELHKFEEIRYPDGFSEGMSVTALLGAELVGRTEDTRGRYQLHVHEVDELIVAISEKSSIDLQKYTFRLPPATRMYIAVGNSVADKILKPSDCE